MDPRHEILRDASFWSSLEFDLCGWFASASDPSLRGRWCDGVLPELARNTREGIEVTGKAWIMNGSSADRWEFTLSVPQKMLRRRRAELTITEVMLDQQRKTLSFSLVRKASEPPGQSDPR